MRWVEVGVGGEILELAEEIKPLLAGHGPAVQGGALAELVSIWVAGHWIPGEAGETADLREKVLESYMELVRDLLVYNAREMGTEG